MMFKNVMALKLFHFIMLRYLHVCALSNFDKQSFSVIRNSSFVISLTTFRFEYVSSVVGCASLCTIEGSCCTASYDRTSGICSLDSCCYPTKELSVVRTFIRKRTMNVSLPILPKDCSELPVGSTNGVYIIYPVYGLEMNVYCEMESDCHGWTVVQRRLDGSTDFNVGWANYKAGFGDLNREYWIGNDNLHVISSSNDYLLRFDLEDFDGDTTYAEYSTFRIGNEASRYILSIGGYSGTAGDSMVGIYSLDGFPFTTKDKDNDFSSSNCADSSRKGAWWFRDCARVNPNGLYKPTESSGTDCIYWREWQDFAALKAVTIKIRPHSTNL